jgi:hypothetical protein
MAHPAMVGELKNAAPVDEVVCVVLVVVCVEVLWEVVWFAAFVGVGYEKIHRQYVFIEALGLVGKRRDEWKGMTG